MKKISLLVLFCLTASLSLFSQNPELNTSFGDQGIFLGKWGVGNPSIFDAVMQKDGKMLLAGRLEKHVFNPFLSHNFLNPGFKQHSEFDYFLARFHANGQLDSTFGDQGFIVADYSSMHDVFNRLAVDSSGRIKAFQYDTHYTTAGFDAAGNMDSSYVQGSIRDLEAFMPGSVIRGIYPKSDGKSLWYGARNDQFFIMQFQANAKPDSSFGSNGWLTRSVSMTPVTEEIRDVELQYDSLILMAGFSQTNGTIFRLLPDGTPDSSFADQGVFQFWAGPLWSPISHVHVEPDGKFFVLFESLSMPVLAGFLPDGSIDSSRFTQGYSRSTLTINSRVQEIFVKSDGSIFFLHEGLGNVLITKLLPNGFPDPTFGFQGQVNFSVANRQCKARKLFFLPADQLLIVADCNKRLAFIRLNADGSFDPQYYGSGFNLQDNLGYGSSLFTTVRENHLGEIVAGGFVNQDRPHHILGHTAHSLITVLSSQGKSLDKGFPDTLHHPGGDVCNELILAADTAIYYVGTENVSDSMSRVFFLRKMYPNGRLDLHFGNQGKVHFHGGFNDAKGMGGEAIALQPDGKILVAATLGQNPFQKVSMAILRFLPDGSPDNSFNTTGYRKMGNPVAQQSAADIALLPQGDILIGGFNISANILSIAKADRNGIPISSFGNNGYVDQLFSGPGRIEGGKFAVKKNGKIVQVGSLDGKILVLQYQSNGSLDNQFGVGGKKEILFFNKQSYARNVAIAENGDILIVGDQTDSQLERDIILICLDDRGNPKSTFGQSGTFVLDFSEQNDFGFDILPQKNGELILAGAAGGEGLVARFLSELALDISALETKPLALVYPNPVSSEATLQLDLIRSQQLEVQLHDMQGRLVKPLFAGFLPSGEQKLHLIFPQDLPAGYYLLHVNTEEGQSAIRLLYR